LYNGYTQEGNSRIPEDSLQLYLVGVWGQNPHDNASLEVTKDSIYYPDNDKSYRYVVTKGMLICFNETNDTNYICKVIMPDSDSLLMMEKYSGEKSVYIRIP
jgi:hypothetical protein